MKETAPMSNETNDRIDDLERRLAKAEEQLVELMAYNEITQEYARQLVELHLGRPPTAADLEHLVRGENLNANRSVAAADIN
jgi:hypothetical protein